MTTPPRPGEPLPRGPLAPLGPPLPICLRNAICPRDPKGAEGSIRRCSLAVGRPSSHLAVTGTPARRFRRAASYFIVDFRWRRETIAASRGGDPRTPRSDAKTYRYRAGEGSGDFMGHFMLFTFEDQETGELRSVIAANEAAARLQLGGSW